MRETPAQGLQSRKSGIVSPDLPDLRPMGQFQALADDRTSIYLKGAQEWPVSLLADLTEPGNGNKSGSEGLFQ